MKAKKTAVDLFQGAGGASLGLKNAGYKVVAAVDIDSKACETYKTNLKLEPICGDMREITGENILERYGLGKGDVDLVVGCPPCQGFSSLRRTRYPDGNDDRNDLVGVFLERIIELEPKVVIFENVPGLVGEKGCLFFDEYIRAIEKMDYATSWDVLNAADYGIPQYRRRVVVISVRDIKTPPPMPIQTHARPSSVKEELEPWRTVEDTIMDLPPLEPGEACPNIPNHVARNHSQRILELISLIPKNGGSRKSLPEEYWLTCHKNLEDGKGAENIYGRMWWDKPSPTMTSRCTTPSSGRFLHPEQNRAITPREAARFQTFPDDFEFPEQFTHAERQIGNAVPAKLIEVIVRSVKDF